MARIKKIQENGSTIYPVTIPQAIKDPTTNKTLNEKFNEYVSKSGDSTINGNLTAKGFIFGNKPEEEEVKFWLDDGTRKNTKELNIAEQDKEYKKLTSGFAYEIVGDGQTTSEKFSFRPTGGPNRNVRDGSARIEVLKGNSVVWNQLVDADTTSVTLTANHKYITNIGGAISLQSPTSATTINVEGGVDKVTDLTQMFGAGNEPTTVEQFYELLSEGVDINAYNGGEIVDANYKAIKTTGFNQWDEQWEEGSIDGSTGNEVFNSSAIRSKGYIRVIAGAKYNIKCPSQVILCAYDENYNYIGYLLWGGSTTTFTIPSNSKYIRFGTYGAQYGPTYKNDICINIAWDEYSALNGTYKPYKPFERDLSWVNKYFPNGMRSAGNVADEIRFNSTTQQWEAVQKVGIVDLGSLMWTAFSDIGAGWFYSPVFASLGGVNIISEKYSVTTKLYGQMPNKTMNVIGSASAFLFCIHDSTYTDASTFKAAMQGVMLNYELAEPIITPVTEDINLAYDVADYGTEQLVVAEGAQSAPLSAEVVYEPNVLASIKQVAAMLTRLDALETAVATMQASAVATVNEE